MDTEGVQVSWTSVYAPCLVGVPIATVAIRNFGRPTQTTVFWSGVH